MNQENKYIAIIGAGITGLTTAFYLKKAGIKFKIFEKTNHIGGVIRTEKTDKFLYEIGPNSGVIGNAEIANLFEELKMIVNLRLQIILLPEDSSGKRISGMPYPLDSYQLFSLPLFSLYDKFRILGEPFRKKGNNPNETLADLVKRRMGKSFLNYAIDPFILGIYAGDPGYIVPKYALPKLYNLEQKYGSFIGGALKKRKEPKSEDDKKATREIFSVEGGLQQLINAIVKNIGEENIILNCSNLTIQHADKKYQIKINGEIENGFTEVITTANAKEMNTLLPFIDQQNLNPISNLIYAKVTEVTIGFEKWKGTKLNAFGGLVPFREQRNILGVLYMSTLFKNRAPKDGALFTIFVGGIRRKELAELNETELKKLMAIEFKLMMGISDFKPDLFKTTHYQHAIAQYGADSEERLKAIASIEIANKGLHLAGSIGNGVGIADRVKQGKDLAFQIAAK